MGRAPAYIFVVRHGNRLDAANKQWHLQSPTPYDPPLTYSGWNQARATGQRIGEILREREAQDEAAEPPKKKRKFKVVIHSSPFLRCVQTSIGISAGLHSIPMPKPSGPVRASSSHSATNPRSRSAITVEIPENNPHTTNPLAQSFSDLPTPPETDSHPSSPKSFAVEKTVLRLDAFLGEWLTPGYFELITPPPGSSLMLASAKANLLRREDYSNNPNFAAYNNASSAQNWGQSPTPTTPGNSTDSVASLTEALRRAGRRDSSASVTSNGESRLATGGAYVAPSPAYALSHNAEIPNGYVPHARDNCCSVDYQWDSMRGALDWGDGGALGEEWTNMHQRFRRGLQHLVDWYATAEGPTQMVTKERRTSVTDDYVMVEDDEEDVEIESVVILVSHGAGCNALIGAITHQPVLTDVGLASLTEAVRKPGVSNIENDGSGRARSGAGDTVSEPSGLVAIHECYDLKLFASSEHLTQNRSTRAFSVPTQMASPPNRVRAGFTSSPLSSNGGLFSIDPTASRSASATANQAIMRRDSESSARRPGRLGAATSGVNALNSGGITVGSGATSFLRQAPTVGGLWSPLRSSLDTPDEDEDDFLPNFSNFDSHSQTATKKAEGKAPEQKKEPTKQEPAKPAAQGPGTDGQGSGEASTTTGAAATAATTTTPAAHDEAHEHISALRQLGSGAGGLWGSPRPLLGDDISRDLSPHKRRWTVNDSGWH